MQSSGRIKKNLYTPGQVLNTKFNMHKKISKVVFPKDENAHKCIIEWWYFNGHLKDKKGNSYSFMDCLFKADNKKVKIPFLDKIPVENIYFAHSLLTDIKNQKTIKNVQYVTIPSKDSFKRPLLFVNYSDKLIKSDYVNYAIEEFEKFKYRIKTEDFDLIMESTKPPMLEGGKGFVTVCGRDSYYYSLTNLKVKGVIKIKNKFIDVEGKGWIDHQWANVSYNKDKWSWFSIQLDGNTEIMCCEYDDHGKKSYLVDIIDNKGKHESLKKLILLPQKEKFISSITKAKYPLEWCLQIPEREIDLKVKAKIKEQEMVFGTINYWEGPLDVKGTVKGKPVKGMGFMELVGYESNYSNTSFVIGEIKGVLSKIYKKSKKNIKNIWK